jgi:hypothetical protein
MQVGDTDDRREKGKYWSRKTPEPCPEMKQKRAVALGWG